MVLGVFSVQKWIFTCEKKMKLNPYLTSFRNINMKCIKGLNIKPKHPPKKILQENRGKNLLYIDIDNFAYDTKSTSNKNKYKRMGLHQTKKLLYSKTNNRMKKQYV